MLEGRTFDDPRLRAEALFILARALLRLQRSADVVSILEPSLENFSGVDEVCTARMLYGTAVAVAHDVDRGIALLASVAASADSGRANRGIKAEIAYFRGAAHWMRLDYREASRFAIVAERAKVDVLSVRATQLRAFVALTAAHYDDALQLFYRARSAYAICRGRDLDLATQIIFQIATLEMNLRSTKIQGSHTELGGRTIPGASFGPAIPTPTRVLLVSADAWLYAHDGNAATAIRKAHDAIRLAPTPAWQVWALSSGATLFQSFRETGNARYFADEAAKIARTVDWNATTDEERIGLLWLAEVYAGLDPAAASAALRQYDGITSSMDPTRVLRNASADPRLAAWDAYVRGLVARANGDNESAGRLLRDAADRFGACKHLWREALALIELDATPTATRGEFSLDRAALIVRDNFPQSFLAGRVGPSARALLDPIARSLTPAERDVLRRLLDGKSPTEISAETNRAYNTVRKHMHRIHSAFGTHTLAQLLPECHRRGLDSRPGARWSQSDTLTRIS
jgi:DNA-binding CsgD family transcriptional regulator